MAHWVGAQGQVKLAKNPKKSPLWRYLQKTQNEKCSFFQSELEDLMNP